MLMGKTLNGNVMCSVAVRATGRDPIKDSIYNICIIPLDLNYRPMVGQMFDRYIQVDSKKLRVEDRVFAKRHSVVWDQFDEWFDQTIKKGQIVPIVHDWPLVKQFLEGFISPEGVKRCFCDKARDLRIIANYMNDLHEVEEAQLPFPKDTLRYILNNCGFGLKLKYNAVMQAMSMAKSYERMLRHPF